MRERGASILEVVMALAILVVAATGLFATLSAATAASLESARQAQARGEAMTLLEAVLRAPQPTLDCLCASSADGWPRCSDGERRYAPANGYTLVHDAVAYSSRDTFVKKRSDRFYEVQITVGWNGGRSVTVTSGAFR